MKVEGQGGGVVCGDKGICAEPDATGDQRSSRGANLRHSASQLLWLLGCWWRKTSTGNYRSNPTILWLRLFVFPFCAPTAARL